MTNLFRPSVKSVATGKPCTSNSDSNFSGRLNKRPENGTTQSTEEETTELMRMLF